MKITWLGHSCFMVEAEEATVVFDPYAPEKVPGLKLPPLSADMVFSSHDHADHCYPPAVKLMRRRVNVPVETLETFHDGEQGKKRGSNTVTVVELEGSRLVHLGDLGHELSAEQIKKLGRVDILFVPVGGYYTIDGAQAHEVVKALAPKLTVPMHYRGEGFGFDVISTVDAFAALSENVVYADSNTMTVTELSDPVTVIMKCPVIQASS